MNVDDLFGANAGKVWHAMNGKKPMNVAAIKKKTKMTAEEIMAALGWLAREGKVLVEVRKNTHYYALSE